MNKKIKIKNTLQLNRFTMQLSAFVNRNNSTPGLEKLLLLIYIYTHIIMIIVMDPFKVEVSFRLFYWSISLVKSNLSFLAISCDFVSPPLSWLYNLYISLLAIISSIRLLVLVISPAHCLSYLGHGLKDLLLWIRGISKTDVFFHCMLPYYNFDCTHFNFIPVILKLTSVC